MKQEKRESSFHDHEHAVEFDQRAGRSDIRVKLGLHLLEGLQLEGREWVLDIATGTGRFAKPVSERLTGGKVIGLDQALAMLSVAHDMASRESLSGYLQAAGDAVGGVIVVVGARDDREGAARWAVDVELGPGKSFVERPAPRFGLEGVAIGGYLHHELAIGLQARFSFILNLIGLNYQFSVW